MPDICHLFVSELRATFSFRPSLLGVDPNRIDCYLCFSSGQMSL